LSVPRRLTTSSRHLVLHVPARWPWQVDFQPMVSRLRALKPIVLPLRT
jgi:hypothetical protein